MSIELAKELTHAQWQAEAQSAVASPRTGLYINGQFVDATAGEKFESVNPASGEPIAAVSQAGGDDAGPEARRDEAADVLQG